MNTSTDLNTQLTELSAALTGRVAEILAHAARSMNSEQQQKIYEMIEVNLPTVITNTVIKTTSLHSTQGVDHLRANLDEYATQFAQRFIKNDM
jgi:hypothetical protein